MLQKQEILDYLTSIKPQLQSDGIIKLGLFGSYAKGTADIASDIDIVLKSTELFRQKYRGIAAAIYLDDLRNDFMRRFKKEVDICNIASMPIEKQNQLLIGVIYV